MVKVIVILLVLAGLVVFLAYQFGGVATFDPTVEGEALKAKIQPGMTWQQVADLKQPRKYQIIHERKKKVGPDEILMLIPGTKIDYDAAYITAGFQNNTMPNGFIFPYHFSAQSAFQVVFNANGVVQEVGDLGTMADLLDTRGN
ncbi:MAG: hypothetical protein KAY37_12925 [Phycisphaerae bacterium]|nr:hypothetical protein [Phycisphaerae bacterium]